LVAALQSWDWEVAFLRYNHDSAAEKPMCNHERLQYQVSYGAGTA